MVRSYFVNQSFFISNFCKTCKFYGGFGIYSSFNFNAITKADILI